MVKKKATIIGELQRMAEALERMANILETLVNLWVASAKQAAEAQKKPEKEESEG